MIQLLSKPALLLLRQLARPLLSAEPRTLRALAADLQPHDWLALSRICAAQGTAPWVLAHCEASALPLPPPARAVLRQGLAKTLARTLDADRTLARIAPLLLEGPSPPCLLLKGRAVEARAYPPGVLRPCVDVDVLPHPDRAAEAVKRLTQLGFIETARSPSGHVVTFTERDGSGVVELHHRPLCPLRFPGLASRGATADLFVRAQRGPTGWLAPDDVDHSALLLVHLLFGLHGDLRHLADAGMWLRAVRPDGKALAARLLDWQAARAGAAGLSEVQAFDPQAVSPETAAALALLPADVLPASLARRAARLAQRKQPLLPGWLDFVGVLAHLDRPLPALLRRVRPPMLDVD